MKFCVTFCLDVEVEADDSSEAYEAADEQLRGAKLVEHLHESDVTASLTHVSTDVLHDRFTDAEGDEHDADV